MKILCHVCIGWCTLYINDHVALTLFTGSLLCGLLEDTSLFLWMPGSEDAPVICSTPLNGMKIDAKDWKGWTLGNVAPSSYITCLFQARRKMQAACVVCVYPHMDAYPLSVFGMQGKAHTVNDSFQQCNAMTCSACHTGVLCSFACDHIFLAGIRLFVAPNGKSLLLVINSLSLLFVTVPRMNSHCSQGTVMCIYVYLHFYM